MIEKIILVFAFICLLTGCSSAMKHDDGIKWSSPDYIVSGQFGGILGAGAMSHINLEVPTKTVSAPDTGDPVRLQYDTWNVGLSSVSGDGFRDESDATFGSDLEEANTDGFRVDFGYRKSWASSHYPESYSHRIGNYVYTTYTGRMNEGPTRVYIGAGASYWSGDTEYTYTNFPTENESESDFSLYVEVGLLDFMTIRYDSLGGFIGLFGGAVGF